MRALIIFIWTISTVCFANTDSLSFLKNELEYREIQEDIHQQLKEKILSEVSVIHKDYKQILSFLHYNRPQILAQEIEMKTDDTNGDGRKKLKPGSIYFVWGYNRAYHGNSDMTFTTPEGTFTVHNAQALDRPTPFDPAIYFHPAKLSIPQYVVKLGYMFNDNWGIELATDHMKWVFVNDIPYEVSGSFSPNLYVNENGQIIEQTFEDIQETGNMTWLSAEHSDGYNYVNISAVYNFNAYKTKNEIFKIDIRPNAGFGLMVPKTKIEMHRDSMYSWQGLDNKFHVAGFGAHVEAKVRLTVFRNFFVEAAARGTFIKINNSLVDGTESRMSQTMVPSFQWYGAAGFNIPLSRRNRRRKKPTTVF